MTGQYIEDEIGLIVESQGSFAPETLNPEGVLDVFSRSFSNSVKTVEVSAAPTIPVEGMAEPLEPWTGGYDVTVITHTRDAGDEGGDTSEYTYEYANDATLSYESARQLAERYIRSINPGGDF